MTTQTKDRTILSPPATSTHSGTTTSTLEISGMTCASCVRRVERALAKVEGVESANVNFASETALVTADGVIDGLWPGCSADGMSELGRRIARLAGVAERPLDVSDMPGALTTGCPFAD